MGTCGGCGEAKPDESFPWRNRGAGIRSTTCKECKKGYNKKWYLRHAAEQKARADTRRDRVGADYAGRIWTYLLAHPCVDCGESDPIVLQFDHVRGVKVDSISTMIRGGWSWTKIAAEIEKCEVRCANCHTRRTALVGGWWRHLMANPPVADPRPDLLSQESCVQLAAGGLRRTTAPQ